MSGRLEMLIPVLIYLALSFAIAMWARSREKAGEGTRGIIEEYFIGGRSLGGFVLAMTIIASYTSASSVVGGPGVAYQLGLSWVLLAMIQVPTTFLTLGVLGKRFAIVARRTGAVTITDYLRARYKSDAVVILCSVALLIFFMAAMLAQFIGGARLFQAVTGYPYVAGLGLFGVTVVLYTALGGFRAVALTDAVQGMVMLVAAVLVLLAVIEKGGGMESCMAALERIDPGLITPSGPDNAVPRPFILSFWVLVGLGILGLPQTTQRCMAYRDSRSMHQAMIMGTLIIGFMILCAHLAGALGRAVFPHLRRRSGHAHTDCGAATALLGRGVHRGTAGRNHVHCGLYAAPGVSGHHQGSVHPLQARRGCLPHASLRLEAGRLSGNCSGGDAGVYFRSGTA